MAEGQRKKRAGKSYRVLGIFLKLYEGRPVSIQEEAEYYRVDERTILRDISDIRFFLSDQMVLGNICGMLSYDKKRQKYVLQKSGKAGC